MSHELAITPGVVLKSIDESEDKSGFRTSYTFIGTRLQCNQQRSIVRDKGARQIQLRPTQDGNWELVATFPNESENGNGDAEQPTQTHELDVQMAQQDVYTNPKFKSALSDSLRQTVHDYANKYKRGEFPSWVTALSAIGSATGGDATALSYFSLIALTGVEHWIFYKAVYSRTITAATPRQVQASFEGVNKLWTSDKVIAFENVPSDWWFKLSDIHPFWHKSMPKVATNIGRSAKTQISYQYIGSDEASALLYKNHDE